MINSDSSQPTELGHGTFGRVIKQYDPIRKQNIAVKVIDYGKDVHDNQKTNTTYEKAKLEVYYHKKLHHPNIVQFYNAEDTGSVIYISMELCEGGSLHSYMRHNLQRSDETIRKILFQLCEALNYMHQKCIIHRDLKPSNILFDKNGNIKLCDFGLAISTAHMKLNNNSICGTWSYIAPETVAKHHISASVDVFALGVIMYELFTGYQPFSQQDWQKHTPTELKFTIPSNLNPLATDLIKKILILNQDQRPSIQQILNHPFFSASTKVEPLHCPFSSGYVDIESNGDLILDLKKASTILRIFPDRKKVEISTRDHSKKQIYEYTQLPPHLQEKTKFAITMAKEGLKRKPLVIWNVDNMRYVMFADYSVGVFVGCTNSMSYLKENEQLNLRNVMKGMVDLVRSSEIPRFPVVIGSISNY